MNFVKFQMGYGKQALKLLKNYYSGNFTKLDETNEDDESDNGKSKMASCSPPPI